MTVESRVSFLIALLGACTAVATPRSEVRSVPTVLSTSASDVSFSDAGLHVVLSSTCEVSVLERWCEPSRPRCRPKPVTVRKEESACPADVGLLGAPVSLRSPWGAVFTGVSDAAGVVDFPIDWSQASVDPFAEGSRELLRSGWVVSDEGHQIETPISVSDADVETLLILIGDATDTQYTAGAANEKASLKADLVTDLPLAVGATSSLKLTISNDGPDPAYRVVAKLRSSVDALHGLQFSFGRIDAKQTKARSREIFIPEDIDDRAPLVVAEITYFNGDSIDLSKRFKVVVDEKRRSRSIGKLSLACKLTSAEVAPGERVRIECTLRNDGASAAKDIELNVSVDGVASPNVTPTELTAGESASLELIGSTSTDSKQGAELPVVITVAAPGHETVEQSLIVRVATFAGMCKQGKLTRDEYRAKRKRLQAALEAEALTQEEFDKYDAELVSCIE